MSNVIYAYHDQFKYWDKQWMRRSDTFDQGLHRLQFQLHHSEAFKQLKQIILGPF